MIGMSSRIDSILAVARGRLRRLEATEVPAALRRGAILVDIRPAAQRAVEGETAAALVLERNVLEWRCDPTSDSRLPQAKDHDVEWVVLCSQGYTSSLAAVSLLDLGLHRATDVIGGYEALVEAGVLAELTPALERFPAADRSSLSSTPVAAESLPTR
jgi:rhodanese-related sulfurtransferase